MKTLIKFALGLISISISSSAYADLVTSVPVGWRLQDYADGAINIFYTGSSCLNGNLQLPANSNTDSKNRLWSLIMTAKTARIPVGIYYHNSGGSCYIDNFYMVETN